MSQEIERYLESLKIKKVQVEGEGIYLKNSPLMGWGVVYPWKNEDGSINWFNFLTGGRWSNLVMTIIIVALLVLVTMEYSNNINMFLNCFSDSAQLEICKQAFGNPELLNIYP